MDRVQYVSVYSASEMTYIVSSGALNFTHSLSVYVWLLLSNLSIYSS